MSSPTERLSFLPDFPGRESLYHPLDAHKDEIRVITVQPSRDRSSTIHCFLQTISIQEARATKPYDAISYFWGSTETTDRIVVHDGSQVDRHDHGIEVPVTYALTRALRQFRAKASELEKPLVLWTDAVCINQWDAVERSQQVTIMRNVYKAAMLVLVWLGEGDTVAEKGLVNLLGLGLCRQVNIPDLDHAIGELNCYNLDAQPDLDSLGRVNAIFKTLSKASDHGLLQDVEDRGADMYFWLHTVSALLDLPYWRRGWTIQEVCANKHVLLHYGQTRCRVKRWESLHSILLVDLAGFGQTPAMRNFFHWVHTVILAHVYFDDAHALDKDIAKRLLTLVINTLARSNKQTSDPRDQVYSQIGSLAGFQSLNIKLDYTLTTERVFMAVTISILRTTRSWSLRQFYSPYKSPSMPSWSIDFTASTDRDGGVFESLCESFAPDLGASFRLQGSQVGSLLTAGFIHDDIVTVEPCDRVGYETGLKTQFRPWVVTLATEDTRRRCLRTSICSTVEDFWESFC